LAGIRPVMPGTIAQPARTTLLNVRVTPREKAAIQAWAAREYGNLSTALRAVLPAQAWGTKNQ
jgi:hypothetical protein